MKMLNPRSLLVFVSLLVLVSTVCAEQQVANRIAAGRPRGAYKPTVVSPSGARLPAGLRVAQQGAVNFIVMVGNAEDGCKEYRYAKAQAAAVGGFFFHGQFGIEDVTSYLVACGQRGTQVDTIYFIGHMSELRHDNQVEVFRSRDMAWAPVVQKRNDKGEMENRVGFIHPGFSGTAGVPGIPNCANWNRDAFIGRLETGLRAANLRPDQVFTDRCRVVFRVCETGTFARKFLDELATLIPAGGEVVGYDIPYVWNFTGYPLGITRFWPDAEQTEGRITIPGSYRAPAPAPAPQAGVGERPVAGGPGAPGALAGGGGASFMGSDQPMGLLGVAMTPPSEPAAEPEEAPVSTTLPEGVDAVLLDLGIAVAQEAAPGTDAATDAVSDIGFDGEAGPTAPVVESAATPADAAPGAAAPVVGSAVTFEDPAPGTTAPVGN